MSETSTKPVFLYFGITGRVLPARMALFIAFGKDGWTDERIDFKSFKEMKEQSSSRLVSGSLPQLTLPSGKTYCQTLAIARWACLMAQKNGIDISTLYPIQNPDHFIMVEEVMAFAMEISDKLPQDPDAEMKKKKREEFAATTGFMGRAMCILEKRLSQLSGEFLLGKEPCLADFAILTLTTNLVTGFFDHIPATYVDSYPGIKKHMEAVQNCAWMKKYVEECGNNP